MLPRLRKLINGRQAACLVVAFVLLAFIVSLMNPLFEATDEIRHYRYVRLLVTEHRLPVQGQEPERTQGHHPPLFYAISALLSWWTPGGHDVTFQYPGNPFWGYNNWEVGVDNKLQYQRSSASGLILQWEYLSVWVARWVNIAIGAVAVWLTYKLTTRLLPDRDDLALGAAALLAYNPQFIYLSAAINNDIIATLVAVAVLYASVLLVQEGISQKRVFVLGLLYGAALLSKLHLAVLGGVIALAVGLSVYRSYRQRSELHRRPNSRDTSPSPYRLKPSSSPTRGEGRTSILSACLSDIKKFVSVMLGIVGIAFVVAGWWFVRNLQLYGDLTGMSQLNAMWGGRPAGDNWWAIQQSIPYLWSSLWGRFGYGQIPLPDVFPAAMLVIFGLGIIGWLRLRKVDRQIPETLVLLSSIALFVAIVLYYILIQPAGAMGRFLFPAMPAVVILIAKGWGGLSKPFKATGYVLAAVMLMFALTALFGYLAPAVMYPPTQIATGDVTAQFADVAKVSVQPLDQTVVLPGDTVSITLDWEPLRTTGQPYAVFVHVVDEAGVIVAQRDTYPGLGRALTTVWQRPFRDEIRVDLPETLYTPNTVEVVFGLYDPVTGQRLAVITNGAGTADTVDVGDLTIDAPEGDYPNAISANFGDQATLLGYDINPRVLKAGETLTLTVHWQANGIDPAYRMFAQVLDSQWNVWGSNDGENITWRADGVITVTRQITLLPDTPPGTYPLQVGLFNGGDRLPVVAEDGRHLDERVLLGPIKVIE